MSFGSFNFVQAKAALSGPLLGDTLAYRLSGVVTRRDGVIDNVTVSGAKRNFHSPQQACYSCSSLRSCFR